jgi:hypothetical protein
MIVDADLPFAENTYFRDLLRQFDSELAQILVGGTTIRSELHKM